MKDKICKAALSPFIIDYTYGNHEKSMKIEELNNYLFIVLTCIIVIVISLYIIFKLLNIMKENQKIKNESITKNNELEK